MRTDALAINQGNNQGEIVTKAIGIARQSRGDEASKSIEEQSARIRDHCKREGWTLVDVHEEQDVSGGTPLAKRHGLRAAVEAIEAGTASYLVVAYFDRLVRSLAVQAEVLERVEAAGGRVLTLDVGEVSSATAGSWLSGNMLGIVAEYHRRTTSERVKSRKAENRAAGRWNGGYVPFYRDVTGDGRLVMHEDRAGVVREAFERRVAGNSAATVQAFLREATGEPIKSLNIVQRMLADESLVTEGVVPHSLFRRVADLHSKRGPKPQSDRLLARLGVLRCECGTRMNVHGSAPYQSYRCSNEHCESSPRRAVPCDRAESAVVHAVREALRDREGRAGANLSELRAEVDRRRTLLDNAVQAFSALNDPTVYAAKLADLEAGVKEAEGALDDGREAAGFTVTGNGAWEDFGTEGRRHLIRLAVESAVVLADKSVTVNLSPAFVPEPLLDAHAADVQEALREPQPATIAELLREARRLREAV
jgi:DNA invertase Pin-like site-specific DNA recombinase